MQNRQEGQKKRVCCILARERGRQSKAWGGAQRNPRYGQDLSHKPAERATAIDPSSMMMKWRMTKSRRPLRGLDVWLLHIPGVPRYHAPPQALFYRLLRRLGSNSSVVFSLNRMKRRLRNLAIDSYRMAAVFRRELFRGRVDPNQIGFPVRHVAIDTIVHYLWADLG